MADVNQPVVKISGYIEKKAKLRIGSPWKKYWFVLEGRLLLYYRSKDEYETLSPCKGLINLGPPCNIKPALSATGVFQIECRASTVTLRAENRSEQERWMQALLRETAQSKSNTNRMSHFRYSMDELPIPTEDAKKNDGALARQNTMPHRSAAAPKKDIIERLQQMGGQTYGGNLKTITKLANKDVVEHNTSVNESRNATFTSGDEMNFKLPQNPQSLEKTQTLMVENDQYSIIQEENSMDLRLDRVVPDKPDVVPNRSCEIDEYTYIKAEDLQKPNEEEKNDFMMYNDQYLQTQEVDENEMRIFMRNREAHLYERISSGSNSSDYNKINGNINENTLYERVSTSSSNSNNQIKANDQYSMVRNESATEDDYNVPVIDFTSTDHNKNSIDSDQYVPTADDKTNENLYSNGLIYTTVGTGHEQQEEDEEEIYEDPDRINFLLKEYQTILYQEIEPSLPPRTFLKLTESSEESSSQTSSNDCKKAKKSKFKLLRQLVRSQKKPNAQGKPKRRSTSFLHKVLKRKTKSLDSDEDITYEVVDADLIERQMRKQKSDMQMLQELQKILEERKALLQKKLNSNENKSVNESSASHTQVNTKENLSIHADKPMKSPRPTLPPRQSSSQSLTNKCTTIDSPTPSSKVKSIDEILQDLEIDKGGHQSKHKVKLLIDKFNDITCEDDVVLRKKNKTELSQSDTTDGTNKESDELSKLLDELSKVTSAPVLTPGVTSSLVTPVLTDEEWLQLIPIRRRRLSDPDYDVPRSHRSLQLEARAKATMDNPIVATRFFGPVLSSPPTNQDVIINTDRALTSMDPDSLELEHLLFTPIGKTQNQPHIKDQNVVSYNQEKIIYAQPKGFLTNSYQDSIYSNINFLNYERNWHEPIENIRTIKINERFAPILTKSEEMYDDSLEPFAEISTAF